MKRYEKYYPVDFDYIKELPVGWELLPNFGLFESENNTGHTDEELLSVTISMGVRKQSEIGKKDASNPDKSKYKLINPGDLVYSMRFRQGASGCSPFRGLVSNACEVLKPKVRINPMYFHYQFRSSFYLNYVNRFSYGIADGQKPLRYQDFKRMYSIVPPLDVQDKIAHKLEFLDKAFFKGIQRLEKVFGRKLLIQSEEVPNNFYDAIATKLITGAIDVESFKKEDLETII